MHGTFFFLKPTIKSKMLIRPPVDLGSGLPLCTVRVSIFISISKPAFFCRISHHSSPSAIARDVFSLKNYQIQNCIVAFFNYVSLNHLGGMKQCELIYLVVSIFPSIFSWFSSLTTITHLDVFVLA